MRVLGIETSTRRGSVALTDGGRVLAHASHEVPDAHAEQLLELLRGVLRESDGRRETVDRIAVGVGPGSFTGLRVGIAFAQGLGLGLDRPVVGVSSLQALAEAAATVAPSDSLRVVALDARRAEVFAAIYDQQRRPVLAPIVLPRATAVATLEQHLAGRAAVWLGEVLAQLGRAPDLSPIDGGLDGLLPHAVGVARLASALDPAGHPPEPEYVRDAGATLPNLPPSPLDAPRRD